MHTVGIGTDILATFVLIGVQAIFYILLFIFVLNALFLAYHWFSFGSSKSTSLLALGIYLGGGAVFLVVISSSLLYV